MKVTAKISPIPEFTTYSEDSLKKMIGTLVTLHGYPAGVVTSAYVDDKGWLITDLEIEKDDYLNLSNAALGDLSMVLNPLHPEWTITSVDGESILPDRKEMRT